MPGSPSRRSMIQVAAAPFRVANYFPGAYLVTQTDLGITIGATPVASNGGGPAGTFSGNWYGSAVPVLLKCTTGGVIGSGADFAAYFDGGTTPAMTGITPTAGVPVALTGAGAGLSHSWAAGTAALNDTWKATASAWADQTTNLKHYTAR